MLLQLARAARRIWRRDQPIPAPADAAQAIAPVAPPPAPEPLTPAPKNKMLCLPSDYFAPRPDAPGSDSGVIYAVDETELPPGKFILRCALQFPDPLPQGVDVSISVRGGDGQIAFLEAPVDADLLARADRIDMAFELGAVTKISIEVRVSGKVGEIRLRYLDLQALEKWGEAFALEYAYPFAQAYDHFPMRRIRNVVLGTIGKCNASCPHCPTNKAFSEHLIGGAMDMAMFRRLVDQIAQSGFEIEGVFAFGLHGDSLMDPHVVERARYVKEKLPRAKLLLNTNAGPWNERRHLELVDLVDIWSIHVEAMDPDLYGRLMTPLKSRIVLPKVERIVALAPGKVSIAVPLSQANRAEFRAIRDHFAALGATTMPLTFANRTIDVLDYYGYALAPMAGNCRQEVAGELIIDWDGLVMACCQDFSRGNAIGDLKTESFLEIMGNKARQELFDKMKNGQWSDYRTCRDCKMDNPAEVMRISEEG